MKGALCFKLCVIQSPPSPALPTNKPTEQLTAKNTADGRPRLAEVVVHFAAKVFLIRFVSPSYCALLNSQEGFLPHCFLGFLKPLNCKQGLMCDIFANRAFGKPTAWTWKSQQWQRSTNFWQTASQIVGKHFSWKLDIGPFPKTAEIPLK